MQQSSKPVQMRPIAALLNRQHERATSGAVQKLCRTLAKGQTGRCSNMPQAKQSEW